MNQELQKSSDSRSLNESHEGNAFANREQLVSGFNDLPSNHSVDQSLQMQRNGELSFAPMADDNLASSVMGDSIFQLPKNIKAGGVDELNSMPGGVFSIAGRTTSDAASTDSRPGQSESDVKNLFGKMSRYTDTEPDHEGGVCRNTRADGSGASTAPGENGTDNASDVQKLINKMGRYDKSLAGDFANSADGGASVLASAMSLQEQMLTDPNLAQDAKLDGSILKMDKQLASLLSTMPGGEQMMSQMMQAEQQALATLEGGAVSPPPIEPPAPQPVPPPELPPAPPPELPPAPPPEQPPTPTPTPNPTPGTGTDMTSIFQQGDSGVSSTQMQHAIDIANALPEDMKQTLLANGGVSLSVLSGFNGGPQGQNSGTSGDFYADSGMADQAEVHELYEMYGQLSNGGAGSWSDSKAVSLADAGMNAAGPSVNNEGDLNDTVGSNQGDGDHMSNAFTADFFATHAGLNHDSYGQDTLALTAQDDPALVAYIAQAQGLTNASA